ncbi:hypothetical protein E2C01_080999 [Portunus trituberculatus]|uniref:Uncharacterized protein n=1 Tax=Portunus trituberculatus TaxID=210409 RepID=A0A5B7IV36_PORTR|nr:hypothetical protein [Portunus trituberculatus]
MIILGALGAVASATFPITVPVLSSVLGALASITLLPVITVLSHHLLVPRHLERTLYQLHRDQIILQWTPCSGSALAAISQAST